MSEAGNARRVAAIAVRAASGAAGGAKATVAMTAAMGLMQPLSRGPLAPKQVTDWLLDRVDSLQVDEPARTGASMVNHLGYGTFLGAVYGLLCAPDRRGVPSGIGYGLAVWALNYAGLLPALGVLPPPHRDDPSHAVRVHVAHWVYGAVLGGAVGDRDAR